jgi:hypothetical protein
LLCDRIEIGRGNVSIHVESPGAEAPSDQGRARLAGAAELDELQPRPREPEQTSELVGVPVGCGLVLALRVGLNADGERGAERDIVLRPSCPRPRGGDEATQDAEDEPPAGQHV